MTFSKRDIGKAKEKPIKEPLIVKFLLPIFNLFYIFPPVKKLVDNSAGGLNGQIFKLMGEGEYESAAKIAIFGLKKYRNKKSFMIHFTWWQLMEIAVECATKANSQEIKERLVEYGIVGVEPFEGYDVAKSFLEFSKWSYQANDATRAIEYATISFKADVSWAEPDFILGWYALVLGIGNAEDHLSKAIEKDTSFLFRVVNDNVCKKHPVLMSKLKKKYFKLANEA